MSNNKKQHTRLSPEYVLLGFLFSQPGYGYELHKCLEDEFGYVWHVSQSQIYNILNRLVEQGYIASQTIEQGNLPARHLLRITPTGEKRFNEWLELPTSCSVHAIRVEFLTRLYFLRKLHPERVEETIRQQSDEVSRGLIRLMKLRESLPEDRVFNQLALELRIQLLNSITTWLDNCREKIYFDE